MRLNIPDWISRSDISKNSLRCEERQGRLDGNLPAKSACRSGLSILFPRRWRHRRGRENPFIFFILLLMLAAFILYSLSNYFERVFYDPYFLGTMVFAAAGLFALLLYMRGYLRKSVRRREYAPIEHRNMERPVKKVRRSAKEQVTILRSKCSNCGSRLVISGSTFCANCGARLQETSMGDASKREYYSASPEDECMVCDLEMKPDDKLLWCPYCGNAAHREHLLTWLRVRPTCPICNRHIAEAELKKLEGKPRSR